MTHERDVEHLLDHWLADGPTEAPDRVFDVVAERIEHQPQRPAWRLPRRKPNVSMSSRAVAGAAAVILVAIVGYNLSGGPGASGIGGPAATASPSPTAPPSPSPSLGSISSVAFRPAVRLLAPAGWVIADDQDRTFVLQSPAGPSRGATGDIGVMRDPVIGDNSRDCEGQAATGGVMSVAAMVTALSNDPRLSTTSPVVVSVGDRAGQALDIEIAQSWTGTCKWSDGKAAALLLTVADPPGPYFGLTETERVRVILFDVSGSAVLIGIDSQAGSTFDALVADAMPIVESMQFSP